MEKHKRYKLVVILLAALVIIESTALIYLGLRGLKPAVMKPPAFKGRIAIVIDDWGYSLNNLQIVSEIKQPLTAALLPNLTYSKTIAEKLHSLGIEVILHLPMEPLERYHLEKNTVMVSMDEAKINRIIEEDLANLLYAKGVSNHMGSLATQDSRVMSIIFKELKLRHLYFLDSLVSTKSICAALAKKVRIGFARRDIFLDNTEDPEYIRGQVYKLKMRARVNGSAIGIGHDRSRTLEVLKEIMPQLQQEGYKFVFLSELVR